MGISMVYSIETGYTIFLYKGITMFSLLTVAHTRTSFPMHPTNLVE